MVKGKQTNAMIASEGDSLTAIIYVNPDLAVQG
jgi:hypothetical protein